MPQQPTTILAIINGLAALIGLYVAARAFRAYRQTRIRFMLMLAAAFSVLTAALVVEGFVFEVLGVPLAVAHVVEASFNLVAFLILAASLHAPGEQREERVERDPPEVEEDLDEPT